MSDDDDRSCDADVQRRDLFRVGAALAVGVALPACGSRNEPAPAPDQPAGPAAPGGDKVASGDKPAGPAAPQPPPPSTAIADTAPAVELV